MGKKFMYLFTTLVIALFTVSCGQSEYEEMATRKAPTPTPTEERTPVYVDIVDGDTILLDEDGNRLTPRPERVVIALKAVPDTAKAAGAEAWTLREGEANPKTPSYEGLGGSSSWAYNHGNVATEYSVYALYKGRKLPLWKPERLRIKQEYLRTETDGKTYSVTDVRYSLSLGTQLLAKTPEVLMTEVGYVPSWLANQWFARHDAFNREATRSGNSVTVKCNNTATFWQLFDDNSHRDSLDVDYTVLNKFNMTIPEMEVEDKSTLYNKSFAFTAETATVQGNNVKAEWQSAAIQNNIPYNGVNYKDSIAPCVAYAKNLVFNADATAVTVYFFEKGVVSGEDYATVTMPVTVKETVKFKELVKTFVHNAFRSNATVSGSNIAVLCDNTATFQKTYTNGSKDEAKSVKYVVTNNFTYNMPAYISGGAKGKTYTFNSTTAVVEGKNVTVTFASRVIGDIVYESTNYKSDKAVPQCEVAVKSIKFGETTAIITFTHDKETVTAEVPVTYNTLKGYERVGDPIHDSWNTAYGTSNGFGIKCDNHVVVREVMTDGSKGNSFDLPYKSTNVWVVSGKTSFEVNSLASVLNVRHDIVNGSATIDGNTINFAHSMSAEKVSKGTFSYQPSPCEAVARYITVTSSTTARVDIYHENTKVGEYTIPVNITEKLVPDTPFDGVILSGSTTDHYADHVSSLTGTDDHVLTKVADGDYRHYWRPMGSKNWSSETLSSIGNLTGKNLAWWYESDKTTRHLGYVEAYERDGESDRWLLLYFDNNGIRQYSLGKAEETINAPFRYPVQRTLQKVVKDGKTLWTFDNVEFFASK